MSAAPNTLAAYNNGSNGTASQRNGQRNKITFMADTPTYVTLDGPGQLSAGAYGDQWQYIVDGGDSIMWVEPAVHEQIIEGNYQRKQELCIEKRSVKKGNRRGIEWHVTPVEDETAVDNTPAPQPTAAPAASQRPEPPTAASDNAGEALIAHHARALELSLRAAARALDAAGLQNAAHDMLRSCALSIYINITRDTAKEARA